MRSERPALEIHLKTDDMSRKLTTYQRPPILETIARCPHISVLASYREQLGEAFRAGGLQPSDKTRREWNEALWVRVLQLIHAAPTCEEATLIVSTTLSWPKPADLQAAIEQAMQRRCAELPSPTERLKASGIVIEGVTA